MEVAGVNHHVNSRCIHFKGDSIISECIFVISQISLQLGQLKEIYGNINTKKYV